MKNNTLHGAPDALDGITADAPAPSARDLRALAMYRLGAAARVIG